MNSAAKPAPKNEPEAAHPSQQACYAYLASLGYRQEEPADQIKAYQRFMGLPETGEVDEATRSEMSLGRCGVPDPQEDVEFGVTGTKWKVNPLRYFVEEPPGDLTKASILALGNPSPTVFTLSHQEFKNVISQSFERWATDSGLQISETNDRSQANITLGFRGLLNKEKKVDGFGNTLGVGAFPPATGTGRSKLKDLPDLTIAFDTAEPWMSLAQREQVTGPVVIQFASFIDHTLVHEIGHALGLAHTRDKGAIMFPTVDSKSLTQPNLSPDDILGIRSLYLAKNILPEAAETETVKTDFVLAPNGHLLALRKSQPGLNRTEVHEYLRESNFQTAGIRTETVLEPHVDEFAFCIAPNADLIAIKKQKNAGTTEVHELLRSAAWQQFGIQTPTALEPTDSTFEFCLASNRDLIAIKKKTGTGKTEVHEISRASGYKQFSFQIKTILEEVGDDSTFCLADNRDLIRIKTIKTKVDTDLLRTTVEVHLMTRASDYQQFGLQQEVATIRSETSLPAKAVKWAFLMDGSGDLIAIQKNGTKSGKMEFHHLSVNVDDLKKN